MPEQQPDFGFDAGHNHDRDREHEVDRTPPAVVLQGLNRLCGHYWHDLAWAGGDDNPVHVLDPCAGSGVFAQQFRRSAWVHGGVSEFVIEGVERRAEEADYLDRHHACFVIADVIEFLGLLPDGKGMEGIHLAVGNPAFSLFTPKEGPSLIDALMPKMAPGGVIMMLGLNDLGSRGSASRELFQRHPPVRQMRIGGTLKFRNGLNPKNGKPYGCDTRSYSWWVWQRMEYRSDNSWTTEDLPCLSAAERQWKTLPGREEA